MSKFKSLLIIIGLLSSTIVTQAEDYALINTYPLFNDMKTLSKQHKTLINIQHTIKDKNHKEYKVLTTKFSKVLTGLEKGNNKLRLKGTKIPELRIKLATIQKLWKNNQTTFNESLYNTQNTEKAFKQLNTLTIYIEELQNLYQKSYDRYKQHSIIGSIVKHHMQTKEASERKILVLNTVQ